jgi:ubiquitin carboxyl-terminal hydrolase 14
MLTDTRQRRVKFPLEFDVLDLCTDELRQKLLPINTKLKEFERDRAERRKVRRRTKIALSGESSDPNAPGASSSSVPRPTADVEMTDVSLGPASSPVAGPEAPVLPPPTDMASPTAAEKQKSTASSPPATAPSALGAALEPESVYRERERAELEALIPSELREDVGCSVTGLYELVGIVAHKGAAADSGHYIGFVKKRAVHEARKAAGGDDQELDENDEDWYKFDDDKVSVFPVDKLPTLEGGGMYYLCIRTLNHVNIITRHIGEDASAYVLLYRSKPLA